MNYAILDIETTGGSPKTEKITEIAIYIHDGAKVIKEYSTLINPEKNIPYFITGLTGITNEMVADAPKFYEIAKDIVEITEGCIVVGHNVNFDYSFIQSEFKQLGFEFFRKSLCTVKLSRKLIPGYKSYSLGKLCKQLDISINGRHRAAGDAFATVKLFELLLQKNSVAEDKMSLIPAPSGKIKNLNGFLEASNIDDLPAAIGVYYLHDSEKNLIYIGKSKNIHSRILAHLGNKSTRKAIEMREKIAGISYELTGSELISLLLESSEIKKHKPLYNRAQRRTMSALGLYSFIDEKGYINFKLKKTSTETDRPITGFNNLKEGRKIMNSLIEKFWLCQKLSGMYYTDGACFHYDIRQCNGACIGKESVKIYNERAEKIIAEFSFEDENMIIIDKGRTDSEKSVIWIESGVYKGYAHVDINESYLDIDSLKSLIKTSEDNREVRSIIKSWMKRNKVEKVVRF